MLIKSPQVQNIDGLQKVMIDGFDLVVDDWRAFRNVSELETSRPKSGYLLSSDPSVFPSTLKKLESRFVSFHFP